MMQWYGKGIAEILVKFIYILHFDRTVNLKVFEMCMESLFYDNNLSNLSNFGQNTAEFYDKHILLSMICIFLSEFGLKSRN